MEKGRCLDSCVGELQTPDRELFYFIVRLYPLPLQR